MKIIRTIYELDHLVARHRRAFTKCRPYKLTWYVSPEQWAHLHMDSAGGMSVVYKCVEDAARRLDITIVKTLEFDSYLIATPIPEVATSISTCDLESGQDKSKKETLGFYSYAREGAMLPPTEELVANLQLCPNKEEIARMVEEAAASAPYSSSDYCANHNCGALLPANAGHYTIWGNVCDRCYTELCENDGSRP